MVYKSNPNNAVPVSIPEKSPWGKSVVKIAARRCLFLLIIIFGLLPSKSHAQFRKTAVTNTDFSNEFPRNFLPGCSGDKWIANDKYRHFVGSAFAAAFGYLTVRYYLDQPRDKAILFGGGLSFSVGLGKELHDKYFHAGCASWKDLAADLLGMTFGLIFYTETIRWK